MSRPPGSERPLMFEYTAQRRYALAPISSQRQRHAPAGCAGCSPVGQRLRTRRQTAERSRPIAVIVRIISPARRIDMNGSPVAKYSHYQPSQPEHRRPRCGFRRVSRDWYRAVWDLECSIRTAIRGKCAFRVRRTPRDHVWVYPPAAVAPVGSRSSRTTCSWYRS